MKKALGIIGLVCVGIALVHVVQGAGAIIGAVTNLCKGDKEEVNNDVQQMVDDEVKNRIKGYSKEYVDGLDDRQLYEIELPIVDTRTGKFMEESIKVQLTGNVVKNIYYDNNTKKADIVVE